MTSRAQKNTSSLRRSARRPDDGDAFFPDIGRTHRRIADDDAEAAGEEAVATMTSGDYVDAEASDELAIEELGGPFRGFTGKDVLAWQLSTTAGDELV